MTHWWSRKRKIAHLPGTKRTPDVALAQTLEKALAGKVKSVYIGIEWEDGTHVGDWSNMPISSLLIHARVANRNADSVLFDGKPAAE